MAAPTLTLSIWCLATGIKLFGANDFRVRLPSLLTLTYVTVLSAGIYNGVTGAGITVP